MSDIDEDENGVHFESPPMENRMHLMLAKMMEDKHTFTYKKLVVPMSMRSIYWKYFGFPATDSDEILTKVKIVCTLCKKQIAYNRNTSNLRMHLHNKHPDELHKLEAAFPRSNRSMESESARKYSTPRRPNKTANLSQSLYSRAIDGSVSIEGDLHFMTDPSVHVRTEEDDAYESEAANHEARLVLEAEEAEDVIGRDAEEAVADFITTDLVDPSVAEGRGFQHLLTLLAPHLDIPSSGKLRDSTIPRMYAARKEAVASSVANLSTDVGLCVEEWQHCNGETYVTLSVTYQERGEDLETKVLSTVHCCPQLDWDTVLDHFLLEWGLRLSQITAVVISSSQQELYKCLQQRQLITVSCLVFSMQICASTIFAQEDVSRVMSRARALVSLISRSPAAKTALQIQQQLLQPCLQECDAGVVLDHPAVWTTSYNLLEGISQLRTTLDSILDNLEPGLDMSGVSLTEADWSIVEDVVTVLEPFKVTQVTLCEEKAPLVSLLRPLLWQLGSLHLKPRENDSELARALKEALAENLAERYSDAEVDTVLQTATVLDPRFKNLPYAGDADKEVVNAFIREELNKLAALSDADEDSQHNNKKPRLSGLELILGDLCSPKCVPERDCGTLELAQYQSEASAALDDCPLQWWARAQSRCPNLARLAQRYNCVPASAIPVHRIPSQTQARFNIKRASLEPDLIDQMLFLNANR